ncbi:hypothetical protein EDB84DRAFT_1456389 [Lactarius hengduanensis]|nr:hypothetical protein EDB84DRAFT_1456389 [Lactarius hengduanensis]
MPRRPAPTPLILYQGPLPPRSRSKFTMPSIPRPIFLPPSMATRGPTRRQVHNVGDNTKPEYGMKGVHESPPGPVVRVGGGGGGRIRGPWDHSGSCRIDAESGTVVMPPKAAVGTM